MDNYTNVRTEHLNHHGYLFGGIMLKWVDEFAWMAASLDFPGCTMVTVAMDNIVFKQRVMNGAILRFVILPAEQGNKSVTYSVTVYADEPGAVSEKEVFSTNITFVRVDENGKAFPLPKKTKLRSEGI